MLPGRCSILSYGGSSGTFQGKDVVITLPETNSSPLKMDGWKTILSYWVSASFQGENVKLRGGKLRGGMEISTKTHTTPHLEPGNSSPEFPGRHLCFQDLVPAFITYTPEQQKRVMLKMFKMYLNAYGKKSASSVILTIIIVLNTSGGVGPRAGRFPGFELESSIYLLNHLHKFTNQQNHCIYVPMAQSSLSSQNVSFQNPSKKL